MKRCFPSLVVAGVFFAAIANLPPTSAVAQNIIGSQIAQTKTYPATAKLIVDTPSGFDPNNPIQPFLFDGTNLQEFNVIGTVTIRQSAPTAGFTDLISGNNYNGPGGLTAIQQEIVSVNATSINGIPAPAGSLILGDGIDDGIDSTPAGFPRSFFSTGGAVENNPNGSTADAFLNLFLQVDLASPLIQVPADLQALLGLDATYPIGPLYNANAPLHLERTISSYQPFGQGFTIPLASPAVELFMRTDNALLVDLNASIISRPLVPMRAAIFTLAEVTIVPEPSSASLAIAAVGGLLAMRRRRKRRVA